MIIDPQFFQAALLAVVMGIPTSIHLRNAAKRHREHKADLEEVEKAMKDHFDSMDKIMSDIELSDAIKIPMYTVTEALDQKHVAIAACNSFMDQDRKLTETSIFQEEVDRLRDTRPEIVQEIETAMATAMFIMMLRWPETSRKFKHFVVESMINDSREIKAFSKISEVARDKGTKTGMLSDKFGTSMTPSY